MKKYFYTILILLVSVSFSQTISDLEEARKIYEEYKSGQIDIGNEQVMLDTSFNGFPIYPDTLFQKLFEENDDPNKRYFGYNYFTLRDSIRVWPNVSAPDNYILGAGDKLSISIWGRALLNSSYYINIDGNIYDESIGLVNLGGKKLMDARIILLNKYSEKISSLKGNNPTSFINVSLGKLKSINVHFVGRVKYPGVHLVHPLSNVMNGLLQAGGVDTTGSLRKIHIMRDGELYTEVDLYKFLVHGELEDNIILQNNDVVVVPTRISTFEIEGHVYNPGIFEALPNEKLIDLFNYAGGLQFNTSNKFKLRRVVPLVERVELSSFFSEQIINYNELQNITARNGDHFAVFKIPYAEHYVRVSGQVKEPREYKLTENMTLKELLFRAGGFEDKDFLVTVNMNQMEVLRIDPYSDNNIVFEFNLSELLTTDKYNDFMLQKDDHIVVHKNINYNYEYVNIDGEVYRPGVYALEKNDKTLINIVNKAGGFTDNAFTNGIKIYRDSINVIWNNFNVTLQADDNISVPEIPHSVYVYGEVYNPGYIHYGSGKSVKQYLESAGGLTPAGNRKDVLVVYPNGDVKTNGLFPRKVVDGSSIIVNPKSETEPFDFGEFMRDTISLTTSIILTWVAIERVK